MKMKISFVLLLLVFSSCVLAQIDKYKFRKEITGVTNQWHKIILPEEIFKSVSSDFRDIRILGITNSKDTIETQYKLKIASEEIIKREVQLRVINTSHNNDGYFFTFEIPTNESITQIIPKFIQTNYDWKINLSGSNNQQQWFVITEDYRILSIKNNLTDYSFSKIRIPESRYRYYRLHVKSKIQPKLLETQIANYESINADYKSYAVTSFRNNENTKIKKTEIYLDLKTKVPVCKIELSVIDTIDFYRSIEIQYLVDSAKTEKGWKYNYSRLTSGKITSFEKPEYKFSSKILNKIKIIVSNNDNKSLNIGAHKVMGYLYSLEARFTEDAEYFLVYGNNTVNKPNYDLEYFSDKIPKNITTVKLGAEELNYSDDIQIEEPLIKNKLWLWIILCVIISILGWFTLKMVGKKE